MELSTENNKKRLSLGLFFACFYIIFTYIARGSIINENYIKISLYLFLAWSVFHAIKNKTVILSNYFLWYIILCILCILSLIYAKSEINEFKMIYDFFIVIGVNFAFMLAIKDKSDFSVLFWIYSLSSIVLFFILLITDNLHVEERLGNTLFGNANVFATYFMLSAFCSIWLFLYSKKHKRVIAFIATLVQLYSLALSGGRKFFIIPFIFFYIILLFKRDAKGKKHIIVYSFIFFCIAIILYWSIQNITIIYNTVGHRLISLFNLFSGSGHVDDSALMRKEMIIFGFKKWLEKPVLGYGINNYSYLFGKAYGFFTYSHNNYIEMLVNLGLIGLIVYYSFYLWTLRELFKIKNDASGLRSFFIAYILCLFIFEIGIVSYDLINIQVFIAFSSAYIKIQSSKEESFSYE